MLKRNFIRLINAIYILHGIFLIANSTILYQHSIIVQSSQRSAVSIIVLYILSYLIYRIIATTNLTHEFSSKLIVHTTTLFSLSLSCIILYFTLGRDSIDFFLATLLISVFLYFILNYIIDRYLTKHISDKVLSMIIRNAPWILLFLSAILFGHKYFDTILVVFTFFSCALLYISFYVMIIPFFIKTPGKIVMIFKTILFIPISITMLYFSGQSIGVINLFSQNGSSGSIMECFDDLPIREVDVYNLPLDEMLKNSNFVYRGVFVFRDTINKENNAHVIGSYTNRFLFRDYYLTKGSRFRILRGFGFACNLSDDKEYLLKQ